MYKKNNTFEPKLAIKLNFQINEPCQLCDGITNANIGAELVCDMTNKVVCRACGIQYAPELVHLLSMVDTARLLITSERDFGYKFENGLSWKNFSESEVAA